MSNKIESSLAFIFLLCPTIFMLVCLARCELAPAGLWFMCQIMLLDFLSRTAQQMTAAKFINGLTDWAQSPMLSPPKRIK